MPRPRRAASGGDRPFGEEVAEQVRHAERHVERVHGVAGAEEIGDDRLARDGEHAARHDGRADEAGRSGEVPRAHFRSAYHSEQRRPGDGQVVKDVNEKGPHLSMRAPWRMDERLVRCLSK